MTSRRLFWLLMIATWAGTLFAGGAIRRQPEAKAASSKIETLYTVAPYPWSEFEAWGMIQHRPTTYNIISVLTRGDATRACLTKEDGSDSEQNGGLQPERAPIATGLTNPWDQSGPYRYQGPNSPGDQPDRRERHPLGFPWDGLHSEACRRANVASWHWFLDGMAELDPTLPNMGTRGGPQQYDRGKDPWEAEAYRGRVCDASSGCADVWSSPEGARVAFEFGEIDGSVTAERIVAALVAVSRLSGDPKWEVPALPERGVLGTAYVHPEASGDCVRNDHGDSHKLHEVLWNVDLGLGPQWAPVCETDPRFAQAPGPVRPPDPATLVYANQVDVQENSIGPFVREYGWLMPHYKYGGPWSSSFFERFGKPPVIPLPVPEVDLTGDAVTHPSTPQDGSQPPLANEIPRTKLGQGSGKLSGASQSTSVETPATAPPGSAPKTIVFTQVEPPPPGAPPPSGQSVVANSAGPVLQAPSAQASVGRAGASILVAGAAIRSESSPRAAAESGFAMSSLRQQPGLFGSSGAVLLAATLCLWFCGLRHEKQNAPGRRAPELPCPKAA